jgi:hypothetical protein
MSVRPLEVSVGFLLGTLYIVAPHAFGAQVSGCTPADMKAAIQPSEREYADVTELTNLLQAHGIVVECALRSKMEHLFQGQEGAAVFRTDQGSFNALFLPKPGNWDGLEVVQTEKNGHYLTSFKGQPTPWPANLMDGLEPQYFVKHANVLCITWDERLFQSLNRILSQD